MGIEKRIYSDLPIPPGEYLAEVINGRGITQAELARRLGRPVQAVNEIIKGEKAITAVTALQLERALDVPAHIWTGLESRYQLIKARLEEKKKIQRELGYLRQTPYKQLANLDYVEKTRDDEHKVREIHRFYGVSSLRNLPAVKAYEESFRRGGGQRPQSYTLAAWIRCAEKRAAEIPTGAFDRKKLRKSLSEIRTLGSRNRAECMPELKELLARHGVALVLLPNFPKTFACGATFWLKPDKAVLLMSIRGRSPDAFWFRLFHGIGHILFHGKKMFIDGGKVSSELSRMEKKANDFAAECMGKRIAEEPF